MTKRETYCTIRGLKVWATVGLMLILVLSSGLALANSRFTVTNKGNYKMKVNIYNGGDSVCLSPAKTKTVGVGHTEGYGCEGQGHQRCKINIDTDNDPIAQPCTDLYNTCNSGDMTVANGKTITITGSQTGNSNTFQCTVN